MVKNRKLIASLTTILLVSVLVVGGCNPGQVNADTPTNEPGDQTELAVSSPEMARDAVLTFLRQDNTFVPSAEVSWVGEDISSEDAIATSNLLYSYQDWTISVVSPQVVPEKKIYTVIVVNNKTGFEWVGLVDAYGKVARMDSLGTTLVAPTSTPIPTSTPFPTLVGQ